MKGKRILPASIAVFLLSIGLMWILVWNRQDIDVAINREDTHHIVANTGRGAQRLNNAEHQEMLDRIAAMVNGTYRYKKRGAMPEGVVEGRIIFGLSTKAIQLYMNSNM